MSQTLMVIATEAGTGKSVVSLGLLEQLERAGARASYFKPVGQNKNTKNNIDGDVAFIHKALSKPVDPSLTIDSDVVQKAIQAGSYDDIIDSIMETHSRLTAEWDTVVCEGVDSMTAFPSLDSDINIDIARNIDATLLLVVSGRHRALDAIEAQITVSVNQLRERGVEVLGVIVNRADPSQLDGLRQQLGERLNGVTLFGVLPELASLGRPRMCDVALALDADILANSDCPNPLHCRSGDPARRCPGPIGNVLVAAMGLENALHHFQHRTLIVSAGDREEILLAAAAAYANESIPRPSGIILTGGYAPSPKVMELITGMSADLPVLKVERNVYDTAVTIDRLEPALGEHQDDKSRAIRNAFDENVDWERLLKNRFVPANPVVTPRRFMRMLRDKAKGDKKTIVLPEGDVDRVLQATAELRKHDIVDIILIGEDAALRRQAASLGLSFDSGVTIVNPIDDPDFDDYVRTLVELRKNKGMNEDMARDLMKDRTYYGTMMVYKGRAHGMVSGSTTTTAATLRPALQFVKTKPGINSVSSVFFMALPDRVLVYGDCAVIPNPTVEQLADIAIASAQTAAAFSIEPRVAMLSYSTGASGSGDDVEAVRAATALVKDRVPKLNVEGPIQYDAAIDPSVAKTKLPNSLVAGKATVFVFPDLNTGNNTYKAVQRSANAIAIGPVLQGLNKPVNDLSRGATVTDITNTVIVTAIQAQSM